MNSFEDFWYYVGNQLSSVGIADIIDIIIVAVIFYYSFIFIKERRAGKVASGILLILGILFISDIAGLYTLNFILSNIFQVGLIALIIVFQPELRSAFDPAANSALQQSISEICLAVEGLSQSKTGALIVFERQTKLGDVIKTGTLVDAVPSYYLISNIFHDKAPLHDGAIIIRDSRLYAAGCFLPLSTNGDIVKSLGTRHRAGIGMSENSDALVVIVSEETGIVSVAADGVLKRGFSGKTLEEYLTKSFAETSAVENIKSKTRWFTRFGGRHDK